MSKDNIKVYFVLPPNCEDELSTSEQMQQAFENQIISEWMRETDCLDPGFSEKDVLVFDKFEGEIFKELQTLRCLSIAGPWCIIACLLEGLPVPNNKSPVYNMAMHKLTVTASKLSAEQKKRLKERVEMMGGIFSLHITNSVTHLVTNSVKTQKYTIAYERKIKVMLDSWVEEVWQASLTRNIKADDEEFAKYKCPVFKNLKVCCTGFDLDERGRLQRVITENGGKYSGQLMVGSTDALVCKPGIHSEKFTVALKYKIPCVSIQWIYDSLEKGYTIPEDKYVIKSSSSTSTKNTVVSSMHQQSLNPIFEGKTIKLVGYTEEEREKVCMDIEEMGGTVMPHSYKGITDYAVAPTICRQVRHTAATEIVNDLWVLDCHNANQLLNVEYYHQPFYVTHDVKPLENCVISLSGYTIFEHTYLKLLLEHLGALYQDKLARITLADNSLQATTHLVCLEPSGRIYSAAMFWNRPPVSHHWLLQCAERGQRVDEKQFQLDRATEKSTASEVSKSSTLSTPQQPNSVKRDFVGRKVSPPAAKEEPPTTPVA